MPLLLTFPAEHLEPLRLPRQLAAHDLFADFRRGKLRLATALQHFHVGSRLQWPYYGGVRWQVVWLQTKLL